MKGFLSLQDVTLPLGPVNVLVGPNGAGKTNVLRVFDFLADVVRSDLRPALDRRGGFDRLVFRGGADVERGISISLTGMWSGAVDKKSDKYELLLWGKSLNRLENFSLGSPWGARRKITLNIGAVASQESETERWIIGHELLPGQEKVKINPSSSGLSVLPRLSEEFGSREVAALADFLATFRVFDVDVSRATLPSRVLDSGHATIDADASNLAGFLMTLRDTDEDAWGRFQADAVEALPQLEALDFEHPSGAAHTVVVTLRERGLRDSTPLLDASYGTIRLLGLLAMLYDPNPPALTCVEEIDHGLHPQALELLVERIREASERTQFIIATHSPALADRLRPEELVVCERGEDGSSLIPAIPTARVEEIVRASEGLPLGELWFSGALGGDL
ncbi:AAA family ATPase [Streptosporangium canum]|uniref:AAA family ATPase n=1 Tax=Streptosporangium canum TaxID=324952 RepID=UPI001FE6A0A4|nr:AAA family ATPase [Streptosporangium canum]